jgi:hypothetical protein
MAWNPQRFPDDPTTNMRAVMEVITAPGNSGWLEAAGWDKVSLHIEITGGSAKAQIFRSNKPGPVTSSDGIQHGSDISASAIVDIKAPSRYLMINVPDCDAGAQVSAWVEAV